MAATTMCNRVFGGCRALMAAAKSIFNSSSQVIFVSSSCWLGETQKGDYETGFCISTTRKNPANKREIRCDEKLKSIFNGRDTVGFLEIAKLLSQHFVKSA
ncbi:hypothetical protein Patl1_22245 [Pistacia atlantica]|uniref:Uncharacterized protein n=1 Tax=Pistacia atlantica TaxID=434234 RepID=A0ACC1BKV5_9ROSI|nr:hypothetical protein Patl1_22245 [Pistacia atlantica]